MGAARSRACSRAARRAAPANASRTSYDGARLAARRRGPPSACGGGSIARSARRSRRAVRPGSPHTSATYRALDRRGPPARRRARRTRAGERATTQQPARVAVEAVHDARARRVADAGDLGVPGEQPVHERAVRVARARVHDETGRLGDDDARRRRRSARRPAPAPAGGAATAPGSPQQLDDLATGEPAALARPARRRRGPSPAATSACTSARLQPVSSATARSTRSPASAAGHDERLARVALGARSRVRDVARGSERERPASRTAPIVIARVGDVERRERADAARSRRRARGGSPATRNDAVDEVAERAAEHQRERDERPRVVGPAHRADEDDGDHDREHREQRREALEQAERAARCCGSAGARRRRR